MVMPHLKLNPCKLVVDMLIFLFKIRFCINIFKNTLETGKCLKLLAPNLKIR